MENYIFTIYIIMSCHNNCPQDATAITNHNNKIINKEVMISSSHFTQSLGKMTSFIFEKNLKTTNNWKTQGPMKNGSYARYLAKKTGLNGAKILNKTESNCC